MKYLVALAVLAILGGCNGRDYRNHNGTAPDRSGFSRPAERVKDPVCGMTCDIAVARPSLHKGKTHYFCSEECKRKFEQNPEAYVPNY